MLETMTSSRLNHGSIRRGCGGVRSGVGEGDETNQHMCYPFRDKRKDHCRIEFLCFPQVVMASQNPPSTRQLLHPLFLFLQYLVPGAWYCPLNVCVMKRAKVLLQVGNVLKAIPRSASQTYYFQLQLCRHTAHFITIQLI